MTDAITISPICGPCLKKSGHTETRTEYIVMFKKCTCCNTYTTCYDPSDWRLDETKGA